MKRVFLLCVAFVLVAAGVSAQQLGASVENTNGFPKQGAKGDVDVSADWKGCKGAATMEIVLFEVTVNEQGELVEVARYTRSVNGNPLPLNGTAAWTITTNPALVPSGTPVRTYATVYNAKGGVIAASAGSHVITVP